VFVTLGDLSPRQTRCYLRVIKVMVDLKNLYCPLIRGDLIVETELDLGDRSERFRVERDLILCELHNGDVGHICGEPNFGNKFCVTYACLL
jgi:hypothetical protein